MKIWAFIPAIFCILSFANCDTFTVNYSYGDKQLSFHFSASKNTYVTFDAANNLIASDTPHTGHKLPQFAKLLFVVNSRGWFVLQRSYIPIVTASIIYLQLDIEWNETGSIGGRIDGIKIDFSEGVLFRGTSDSISPMALSVMGKRNGNDEDPTMLSGTSNRIYQIVYRKVSLWRRFKGLLLRRRKVAGDWVLEDVTVNYKKRKLREKKPGIIKRFWRRLRRSRKLEEDNALVASMNLFRFVQIGQEISEKEEMSDSDGIGWGDMYLDQNAESEASPKQQAEVPIDVPSEEDAASGAEGKQDAGKNASRDVADDPDIQQVKECEDTVLCKRQKTSKKKKKKQQQRQQVEEDEDSDTVQFTRQKRKKNKKEKIGNLPEAAASAKTSPPIQKKGRWRWFRNKKVRQDDEALAPIIGPTFLELKTVFSVMVKSPKEALEALSNGGDTQNPTLTIVSSTSAQIIRTESKDLIRIQSFKNKDFLIIPLRDG